MLTAEKLRELLDYSPTTGHFHWKVGRRRVQPGDRAGYVNGEGYVLIGISRHPHRAHRLVWLYETGRWPVGEIDHINGDKTDNRRMNLREVSRRANAENRRGASKHSASGILGVRRYRNKWRAEIRIGGKQRQIGTFETPEEAKAAYLAAKRSSHEGCTI